MGIITARHGNRKYIIELKHHFSKEPELPVENLHAVFLETSGTHPKSAEKLRTI